MLYTLKHDGRKSQSVTDITTLRKIALSKRIYTIHLLHDDFNVSVQTKLCH